MAGCAMKGEAGGNWPKLMGNWPIGVQQNDGENWINISKIRGKNNIAINELVDE